MGTISLRMDEEDENAARAVIIMGELTGDDEEDA